MSESIITIPKNKLANISLVEHYITSKLSIEDVEQKLDNIVKYAKNQNETVFQNEVVLVTRRGPVSKAPQEQHKDFYFGIFSVFSISEDFEMLDWISVYNDHCKSL